MPHLTAIDVLGVQRFVFLSNRLRDVVAGSYLVDWSTSKEGALKGLISVPTRRILMAGGGNAIVETTGSEDDAKSFAAKYSRALHDEVPGLEVAVVHKEYTSGNLARALNEIQIELARAKTERTPSVPLLGLSVTAPCRETGLPATGFDRNEPATPLSKLVLKRRQRENEARTHWQAYLDKWEPFEFPLEFDDLGRTVGETSLIGVVHIDGNGVGEKIKNWLNKQAAAPDDTVRQHYLEWSSRIDELGKQALQAAVDRLCLRIESTNKNGDEVRKVAGKPPQLGFELKRNWFLPLRPILLGGDDLTFVCDGRVALDLAVTALRTFNGSIPHLGDISACAGVAIVAVHTPFARAYQLAEELCASAKQRMREKNNEGCALDWHIGTCRPGESLKEIRDRNYKIPDQPSLTCRPYMLGSDRDEQETWTWLSYTLLGDGKTSLRQGEWAKRRNKVKAFASLAREGPNSISNALKAWKLQNKELRLPEPIADNGFIAQERTPLIDALELLDLHLALDPENTGGKEERTS